MNTESKQSCRNPLSQASGFHTSVIRFAVMASLVGSLAFAYPAFAANDAPDQAAPSAQKINEHGEKMDHSPQAMARRVEERIKTLHDKLGITSEQEAKWGDVAQTMRDNEASIAALVEARHKNISGMTAIDDLQSYEDITQAHADGIKKLIPVFQALYGEMSEDQQKYADKVFGSFEGHGDISAKKDK
ncbi:MAG: Spy/CpxP family protein refolding chaperone [Alphaproteobacteria bacterium]|nr:Spy/CpxP family protein refolding chaperone [Alphaproteobacteria bacterium]